MNIKILNSLLIVITISLFTSLIPQFSSSQDFGISGTWYYGDIPTHVTVKDKERVILDNGQGSTATGYFIDPWEIEVPKWKVKGSIKQGGRRIDWTNGTQWTRFPQSKTHISGRWYHGDRPTSIDVYDNGWRFSITNELGQTSDGTAQSSHVLYIPSLSLTGHVNRDATKITWTNGTTWTRYPTHDGGGGSGPLTAPPPQ